MIDPNPVSMEGSFDSVGGDLCFYATPRSEIKSDRPINTPWPWTPIKIEIQNQTSSIPHDYFIISKVSSSRREIKAIINFDDAKYTSEANSAVKNALTDAWENESTVEVTVTFDNNKSEKLETTLCCMNIESSIIRTIVKKVQITRRRIMHSFLIRRMIQEIRRITNIW